MATASCPLASAYDGEVSVTLTYDDVTLVIASATIVTGTRTVTVTVTSGTKSFSRTFPPGTNLTRNIPGNLTLALYQDELGGVLANGVSVNAAVQVT